MIGTFAFAAGYQGQHPEWVFPIAIAWVGITFVVCYIGRDR